MQEILNPAMARNFFAKFIFKPIYLIIILLIKI
nr:MAG TPA: hypothetical protein [Caudoviricetes sp.]